MYATVRYEHVTPINRLKQPIYSQEFIATIDSAPVESVFFGDGVVDKAKTMAD
jgi:hypothetical protein